MAVNRFITRAYPLKFSPEKAPDDASLQTVSREEVSGLETRILDWTEQLQAGPAGGRLYSNIKLNPIGSTPAVSTSIASTIALTYFGMATWEVVDNATISGTKIVVTHKGDVQSGVVGTDIFMGADAAATAMQIFLYFFIRGIFVVADGNKLIFRVTPGFAAEGVLVSTDDLDAFKPANGIPVSSSLSPSLLLSEEDAVKMRIGDYLRFSSDSSGENLLPDRAKITTRASSVQFPFMFEVILDRFPCGLMGNEVIWAEHDNGVHLGQRNGTQKRHWQIASRSSPSLIWEPTNLGPNLRSTSAQSIYLRTTAKTTVDLWVW